MVLCGLIPSLLRSLGQPCSATSPTVHRNCGWCGCLQRPGNPAAPLLGPRRLAVLSKCCWRLGQAVSHRVATQSPAGACRTVHSNCCWGTICEWQDNTRETPTVRVNSRSCAGRRHTHRRRRSRPAPTVPVNSRLCAESHRPPVAPSPNHTHSSCEQSVMCRRRYLPAPGSPPVTEEKG